MRGRRIWLGLAVMWLAGGCAIFDFRQDLDRALDVTTEYIRKMAAGETKGAYALTSREWQAAVPYEDYEKWARPQRTEYEELAKQPDMGVRVIIREGEKYYATVMMAGRAQTWEVRRQGWKWVVEVEKNGSYE